MQITGSWREFSCISTTKKKRKSSHDNIEKTIDEERINEDRLFNRPVEFFGEKQKVHIKLEIQAEVENMADALKVVESERIKQIEKNLVQVQKINLHLEEKIKVVEKGQNHTKQYPRRPNVIVTGMPADDESAEGLTKAVFDVVEVHKQP